ncbi:MAG: TIGR03086 family metal-binding protein [Acidimicrobiales bacterium]
MNTLPDLEPAARGLADLVRGVRDDQLGGPTPCPEYTLGDLVDHVDGLSLAFAAAATKDTGEIGSQRPTPDASRLGDDWRDRIPRELAALAEAWRDPGAWTGMTKAGGVDLPGEVAGLIALDELVIHAWDLAKASGQPYDYDPASLAAVHGFVTQFSGPGQEAAREGLFGPVVAVPDDAPLLDRVIGLTGRDPAWSPT